MIKQKLFVLSVLFSVSVICALSARAVPRPPADLRVQMTAPATVAPNSPYQYTVKVKNIGGSPADGVMLTVAFPETNTSPQKYILGALSGVGTGCSVVNRQLKCALNTVAKNVERVITFNLALPVSTKVLEIKATATTTTGNESNPLNNMDSRIPAFVYTPNQLTSANVLVSMCTGQGLSSFFECELFPSSQQHVMMSLNGDMSISINGQYYGNWDQASSTNQLHMTLSDGGSTADFNGFSTGSTCFEGATVFTPTSPYGSQYKVCVQ